MFCQRKSLLLVLAALLLLEQPLRCTGQPALAEPARETVPGLVIVIDGIGGLDLMGKSANISFKNAGLPHEVRHFTFFRHNRPQGHHRFDHHCLPAPQALHLPS